ncbi:hypothetical protein U8527_15915 [Kordia algicida OT-1]|uniref:Uncharacterized protein n=1 Tax=Kordia algicida OT-1 TaxID=391587 RepID=A9E423_9FLAO|nr:hypothetical protein [Kordia algicida]EDP95306.1 hypothetical protein KAOT1_09546 [Kordia algicida OT-1]
MKKKNLKSLHLNKKFISNFDSNELTGGTGSVYCSVSCDPFTDAHSCRFNDCFPQSGNLSCKGNK